MRSYFHDVERANIASNNLRTPYIGMARLCCHGWLRVRHQGDQAHTSKLEGRIDDERQFKTAKRSQAPVVTPRFENGFSAITSSFWVVDRKRIAFLEWVIFLQIFNFRDGHVTTFRHPPYICQVPGHRLSRLVKGTPSESRLSIGTIVLDSRRVPKKREKCYFGSGSAHVTNFSR